ncbi:MAG: YitT family protein [Christensenellales bacterium]
MYNSTLRTFTGRMIIATLGCIIMSIGINVFTTPWNFYTTGLVGYSQFLRSVLVEDYGITLSNIDLAGVIYYALSIPIFIITFKGLGRSFFLRTLVFTAVFSLTTAFIPVPSAPVINDRLTCVLIGSVCVGVGDGMVITCGCTVGGLDMLAMHIAKKTGLQVGKFTILANILLCDVLLPL